MSADPSAGSRSSPTLVERETEGASETTASSGASTDGQVAGADVAGADVVGADVEGAPTGTLAVDRASRTTGPIGALHAAVTAAAIRTGITRRPRPFTTATTLSTGVPVRCSGPASMLPQDWFKSVKGLESPSDDSPVTIVRPPLRRRMASTLVAAAAIASGGLAAVGADTARAVSDNDWLGIVNTYRAMSGLARSPRTRAGRPRRGRTRATCSSTGSATTRSPGDPATPAAATRPGTAATSP